MYGLRLVSVVLVCLLAVVGVASADQCEDLAQDKGWWLDRRSDLQSLYNWVIIQTVIAVEAGNFDEALSWFETADDVSHLIDWADDNISDIEAEEDVLGCQ